MFTFLVLLAFGLLAYWFGADSRPGFSDGRVDRKERWSPPLFPSDWGQL